MKFTIKTVAQLTGLSAHTIRAWERRYQVLNPARTGTNRRVYEQEEVERLKLLGRAVSSGHAIGQVAHLSSHELRGLPLLAGSIEVGASMVSPGGGDPSAGYLSECVDAMNRMDAELLERTLVRAAASQGLSSFLETVIIPFIGIINDRWVEGTTSIAQEHLATAVLRTYLESVRITMRAPSHAPRLLVTTPRNQVHELGALLVSIVASMQGWNVTYLGPNLPALEIANAARQCAAHAVGLSLVYPVDDPTVSDELKLLRLHLGPAVPIVVGGRATGNYAAAIRANGAMDVQTLAGLRESLDQIRLGAA